jgi:hypothetical protein
MARALTGWVAGLAAAGHISAQNLPEYELPPIRYSAVEASNRVTALQARRDAGDWQPTVGSGKECLRALLAALEVPVESQVLVFSKTSLQRTLIEPRRPRALYFDDATYVGWVPGGLIEVAVTDPQLGLVFYRFDPRPDEQPAAFVRDADCLSCHGGSLTRNWPGVMVRSVVPDAQGEPITSRGTFLTGHDSPLEERWGGWYVTGTHGEVRHMGNGFVRPTLPGSTELDREAGANVTDLTSFFAAQPYLRGDSDIVALLVLEHQVGMHNRLVQGALRVRKWMDYQRNLQLELGQPVTVAPEGTALRVLTSETERIVEHLLFCGEAPLPAGGVRGAGEFEAAFGVNRRMDGQGRSLKDFERVTRLFRWRCSYMIHAPAFEALPDVLKDWVYRRLLEVLGAADPPEAYAHLPAAERLAVREILLATTPGLAAVWAGAGPGAASP